MTDSFDVTEFTQGLIQKAEKERTVGENKPEQRPNEPRQTHTAYSGRLQLLYLPDDTFVVVFDRWRGPKLDTVGVDMVKKATGARGVLFFEGEIDIEA